MARAILLAAAAAGATALLAASPTLAAEPFNGPYVGIQGGWQQNSNRLSVDVGNVETAYKMKKSGFEYGAQIGLDGRMNDQFVIGAEAFVSGSTGKNYFPDSDDGHVKAGRSFGLLARAGVLATPATLVYGTGGWENARFSFRGEGVDIGTNKNGWTLGAGIEQMLGENLSARVEYRYSRFGKSNIEELDDVLDGKAQMRTTRNRILAGVNYRF